MDLKAYQQWTKDNSSYPHEGKKDLEELMYLGMSLNGEAGELSNHLKKLFRDGDNAERRNLIRAEIGDVLWYAARLAEALDANLEDIFAENHAKIEDRKSRGVIQGDGDKR